jgi:hypothetical protein
VKVLQKYCKELQKGLKELPYNLKVEIDERLREQYEAKLQQSLQERRNEYQAQMRANRDEIQLLYENKVCIFLL